MIDASSAVAPDFLTTREVAELLRVKERKVYELVAEGEIPHRRVTGKLLFPRAEVQAWLHGGEIGTAAAPLQPRPSVLVGSNDPLLDWSLRASQAGIASLSDGSRDGLRRFAKGEAAICALHIAETEGDWNLQTVASAGVQDCVLVAWVLRRQGLISRPDERVPDIHATELLATRRSVWRQDGAGTRELAESLARQAGLDVQALTATALVRRTETEVAEAIASEEADVAIGPEVAARRYGLQFTPLVDERLDLLIDRRAWFTPPVQTLMSFLGSQACHDEAIRLGGYLPAEVGAVRWLSD